MLHHVKMYVQLNSLMLHLLRIRHQELLFLYLVFFAICCVSRLFLLTYLFI